jgi:hypothetical protein
LHDVPPLVFRLDGEASARARTSLSSVPDGISGEGSSPAEERHGRA